MSTRLRRRPRHCRHRPSTVRPAGVRAGSCRHDIRLKEVVTQNIRAVDATRAYHMNRRRKASTRQSDFGDLATVGCGGEANGAIGTTSQRVVPFLSHDRASCRASRTVHPDPETNPQFRQAVGLGPGFGQFRAARTVAPSGRVARHVVAVSQRMPGGVQKEPSRRSERCQQQNGHDDVP